MIGGKKIIRDNFLIKKMQYLTTYFRFKYVRDSYKKWLNGNEKVLDIGCGNGVLSKKLINEFDIDLYGADLKNYLIENIRYTKIEKNIKLPFKDNSFDIVMFNDVLHHIYNQEFILNEALRVADNVFIFDCLPSFFHEIWDKFGNWLYYGKEAEIPLTARNEKEWEDLFNKMNIKFDKCCFFNNGLYPIKHIAYRLNSLNSRKEKIK